MLSGRVGHYEIAELLGAGGMGEVYKARDTLLDRWVAIKALRPDRLSDPRSLPRFRREALSAAALNHPYICNIHELIEDQGLLLIVMELVEGETLADRLALGPLSMADTLRFGCELAEGLAAAHAHGLIHRDLKPSNVMITAHTHVKLMDFGLAKLVNPDASTALHARPATLSGEFVGTLRYMAPEQASGERADARSDVFALGVVLYECLTGHLPFTSQSRTAYLGELFRGDIQPLEEAAPHVPADVRATVLRCLALRPDDRYPSAIELFVDLRRLQDMYVSETLSARRMVPSRRRGGAVTVAASTLVVVALTAAVWRWLAPRSLEPRPARIEAFVTWPSFEVDGRVSPDGRWCSFLSDRDGAWRIWLRRASEGEPRALDTPPGRVLTHLWSPDGNQIACVILQHARTWLYVVPAFFGGTPQGGAIELPDSWSAVRFAGWTADGLYVESTGPTSLWRIDPVAGDIQELQAFHRTAGHLMREFAVSPSGGRVLFASNQDGREDIWVARLDGGDRRRVTDDAFGDSSPVWLGHGNDLVFQSNRGGQLDIWQQSLDDRGATQVTFGSGVKQPLDASTDGSLLLFQQRDERSHLWRLDVASAAASQLTADALSDAWPSVSADGRRVVFQRLKTRFESLYAFENTTLFTADVGDGGIENPVEVADGYGARLSPDGRLVAFLRPAASRQDTELWVADMATHQSRRLTARFRNPGFYLYPFDHGGTSLAWRGSSELLFIDGADGEIRGWKPTAWADEPALLSHQPLPPRVPPQLAIRDDGAVVAFLMAAPGSRFGTVGLLDLASKTVTPASPCAGSGEITLLGWRRQDDLLALRAVDPGGDATRADLLSMTRGRCDTIAHIDDVFPGGAMYVADGDVLYLTRGAGSKHGLFEYSVATKTLRPLIPPEQPGITFGGFAALPAGRLIFTRQEVTEDLWTVHFTR
jgi:Tol biopolymer transport system component